MTMKIDATWLRAQPSLTGTAPPLERNGFSDDPVEQFQFWIAEAAAAGVPEPHTATLATVDKDGMPDARTLILKDVSTDGWAFAGLRSSRKGVQLASHPVAALNFWWQPVMRAVRVVGHVREASRADSDADLALRSESARAGITPGAWVLWRIAPIRIEFWQGAADRRHTRIIYTGGAGAWVRDTSHQESTHDGQDHHGEL